jgi:hypothetical protein
MQKPIDVVLSDELKFAAGLAAAAGAMRGPYTNPASLPGLEIEEEDGSVSTYKITDNALARGHLAVIEQFGPDKAMSILMRLHALIDAIEDDRLKVFTKLDPSGDRMIREELFEIAATFKCSGEVGFKRASFCKAVARKVAANDQLT